VTTAAQVQRVSRFTRRSTSRTATRAFTALSSLEQARNTLVRALTPSSCLDCRENSCGPTAVPVMLAARASSAAGHHQVFEPASQFDGPAGDGRDVCREVRGRGQLLGADAARPPLADSSKCHLNAALGESDRPANFSSVPAQSSADAGSSLKEGLQLGDCNLVGTNQAAVCTHR
jgi:hypothetical protein